MTHSPFLPKRHFLRPTGEMILRIMGGAIAAASGTFGLYMSLYGPGEPNVNGREYLTVFAQFARGTPDGRRPAAPPEPARAVDPTATGSIGQAEPGKPEPGKPEPGKPAAAAGPRYLPGFSIRDVFKDTAVIEDRGQLRVVQRGTPIEGAGTVQAIEQRDGRWVIVTTTGLIAQAPGRK